eukprot:CAMPEP_0174958942 /NCGR_PEP_ID=MMETSP0004_2-20121128/2908_1 /TAXON_ID=420556 /ORGANISM="Ochromonas sp., Strain CCMP1393" /LENGTH=48 /DNA_ID= /DNA_START= /DNA_END= /DNA_ORIENTATION=
MHSGEMRNHVALDTEVMTQLKCATPVISAKIHTSNVERGPRRFMNIMG